MGYPTTRNNRDYGGSRDYGNASSGPTPVNVGDELDVKIEAVGGKGDGIAKHKGFVIFVANTKVGEFIRIKVTKVLPKMGFGEKIGEAQGPPPERRQRPQVSIQPEKYEPTPHVEDSEDFGESDGKKE